MASIYSAENKKWKLRLDWEVSSQSIDKNTSTISLNLWVYDGSGSSWNETANEAYYTIQGEKRWHPYNYSAKGWYKLGSKSVTVSHNADGTKSLTLTAEWDCGFDSSYTPRHLSISKAVTLPTIPRASTDSASGNTLGEDVKITITRASSGFTHKLYYTCGTLTKQSIATDVSTSYTWTPSVSLAQQAPNGTTVAASLLVETYNGATYVGSSTLQLSLAIPTSVVPTLTVAVSDPTGVLAKYGGYVQLRSKLQIKITASGAQGSSIKSYSIKLGSIYAATTASGTTDYLPSSGSLTLTCSVTDSRGRTSKSEQPITVLPYAKPTISAISAVRCKQDGTTNPMGAYGKVTFSGAITSLNSKNTAAYSVQYREVGAENWTEAGTPEAGNFDPENVSVVFSADKNKRYEVRVVATDAFESIGSPIRDLPAAFTLLHLAKSLFSIGIGRLCDKKNALQVGLDSFFDSNVQIRGRLSINGVTDLESAPDKIAVLDSDGTVRYRGPEDFKNDLNLKVGPQGEKGEKGDKGDTGDTGPQGEPGEQGPQGESGVVVSNTEPASGTIWIKPGGTSSTPLTKDYLLNYDFQQSDDYYPYWDSAIIAGDYIVAGTSYDGNVLTAKIDEVKNNVGRSEEIYVRPPYPMQGSNNVLTGSTDRRGYYVGSVNRTSRVGFTFRLFDPYYGIAVGEELKSVVRLELRGLRAQANEAPVFSYADGDATARDQAQAIAQSYVSPYDGGSCAKTFTYGPNVLYGGTQGTIRIGPSVERGGTEKPVVTDSSGNPIVGGRMECDTFVMMILRGLPFEKSLFNSEAEKCDYTTDLKNKSNPNKYAWVTGLLKYMNDNPYMKDKRDIKFAADMSWLMWYLSGVTVEKVTSSGDKITYQMACIFTDHEKAQKGDLFFERSNEKNLFDGISHVGFVGEDGGEKYRYEVSWEKDNHPTAVFKSKMGTKGNTPVYYARLNYKLLAEATS